MEFHRDGILRRLLLELKFVLDAGECLYYRPSTKTAFAQTFLFALE
jgi:hypothetical protein